MHLIHRISARIEACVSFVRIQHPQLCQCRFTYCNEAPPPLSHAIVHVDFITNGTTSDPCDPVCLLLFRSTFLPNQVGRALTTLGYNQIYARDTRHRGAFKFLDLINL